MGTNDEGNSLHPVRKKEPSRKTFQAADLSWSYSYIDTGSYVLIAQDHMYFLSGSRFMILEISNSAFVTFKKDDVISMARFQRLFYQM
ncbi:hypothetical protein CEXT_454381 [Caerostris extrusa]|uniref:Uncharacterized protein n=1 Tax=Caerostris extrusa TaxID=172846 RepID=A0AAV4N0E5_CAEEX|nr:hypothetical protein CEXT_454381 [Caerostris extrusa]